MKIHSQTREQANVAVQKQKPKKPGNDNSKVRVALRVRAVHRALRYAVP